MAKKIKLIVIFYALFFPNLISYSQRKEVKAVEFSKISDNRYEILEGRGVRGGAYIGDNSVLLIDYSLKKAEIVQELTSKYTLPKLPIDITIKIEKHLLAPEIISLLKEKLETN
jgi:hypothetical protein